MSKHPAEELADIMELDPRDGVSPASMPAASAMLRAIPALEAERDALRAETAKLRTVMIAAAEEIASKWEAHCDAEGYGPVNLMHRLEEGIPAEYGYTAGAFATLRAELAALKAAQAAEPDRTIPYGWRFERRMDGAVPFISIRGPSPKQGDVNQRTSDAVHQTQNRDLYDLLGRLADQQAAEPVADRRQQCIDAIRRVQAAYDKKYGPGPSIEASVCSDCIGEINALPSAPAAELIEGCPVCGEDGGTSCGVPNCGLLGEFDD